MASGQPIQLRKRSFKAQQHTITAYYLDYSIRLFWTICQELLHVESITEDFSNVLKSETAEELSAVVAGTCRLDILQI